MKMCPKCGKKCIDMAAICPKCKTALPTVNTAFVGYSNQVMPVQRNKANGCLIAILTTLVAAGVLFIVLFTIVNWGEDAKTSGASVNSSSSEVSSKKDLQAASRAFDAKTWEQFKDMYFAHNDLMGAMAIYSEGDTDSVSFYEYCKSTEKYFMNMSLAFDYGTTEDEDKYLSVFETWAYADQQACQHLLKFIDSFKTSDLENANEQIGRAKDAVTLITKNRGILLKDAGYTADEVEELVKANQKELEELGKE